MKKTFFKNRMDLFFFTVVIVSALVGFVYGCGDDDDDDSALDENLNGDNTDGGVECYYDEQCKDGAACTSDGACSFDGIDTGGKTCSYDSDCDASSVCIKNRCNPSDCKTDDDCSDKTIDNKKYTGDCLNNVCIYKRSYTGASCSNADACIALCYGEEECSSDYVDCYEGLCGPKKCITDYDCLTGSLCNKLNECETGPDVENTCDTDSDCPSGMLCYNSFCREIGAACNDDNDCMQNALCIEKRCAMARSIEIGNESPCANGVSCYEVKNESTVSGVCLSPGEELPLNARICTVYGDCNANEAALLSVDEEGEDTCHCVRKCPGSGGNRCPTDQACWPSTIEGIAGYCLTPTGQLPPGANYCDPVTQVGCDSSEFPFVAAGGDGSGALCVCLKKCTPNITSDDDDMTDDDDDTTDDDDATDDDDVTDDDDATDDDDVTDDDDTCEFETCGVSCCNEGEVCYEDACCAPACEGKDCGDDSCGGVCGTCDGGEECNEEGKCEVPTFPCSQFGGTCVNDGECTNGTVEPNGTCENTGEVCCIPIG